VLQAKKRKRLLYALFLLLILLIIVWCFQWKQNQDQFYIRAYTPVVEKSLKTKEESSDEPHSNQPHPAGFRENDIEKQHGNGYSTY
jgi:hypothetical protein